MITETGFACTKLCLCFQSSPFGKCIGFSTRDILHSLFLCASLLTQNIHSICLGQSCGSFISASEKLWKSNARFVPSLIAYILEPCYKKRISVWSVWTIGRITGSKTRVSVCGHLDKGLRQIWKENILIESIDFSLVLWPCCSLRRFLDSLYKDTGGGNRPQATCMCSCPQSSWLAALSHHGGRCCMQPPRLTASQNWKRENWNR